MSFKRIAVFGAVAVGAMALVGSGYAAAQDNGSSTTLVTSPAAAGTASQAYGGATTSQLSPAGVQALAASYQAGCSVQPLASPQRTIKITVSGTAGTPTGSATFATPQQADTVVQLTAGTAQLGFGSNRKGDLVTVTYNPTAGSVYSSCSGSANVPNN